MHIVIINYYWLVPIIYLLVFFLNLVYNKIIWSIKHILISGDFDSQKNV